MLMSRILKFGVVGILLFPISVFSQNLAGISICIDPGHGPGNVNAGPTGLREADINFRVASFLKEYLKTARVDTVLLTHLNNTTDISLTAREQIANNFGVTWFHSVHHNATGTTNNTARFTLILLEERRNASQLCPNGSASGTGQAEWPGKSDAMSNIMARRIFEGYRTASFITRLDWTFYGGCNGGFNLGVLNDLQMPGELSEATFHDNPLEEAKMRNNDFLRMEARALAMSFFDYFSAGAMPTGALIGIVSDAETNALLNGVTVTLNPGNRIYTTDNFKNGLYVFDGLMPGTYTVAVNVPGFVPSSKSVTVAAHAFNYSDARLTPNSAPAVTTVTPRNDTTNVFVYDPIRVSFSRAMDAATMPAALRFTPPVAGALRAENDNKTFVFEPDFRFEFGTNYTLTIDSTARDIFGRSLDGNRDGVGGDAFVSRFSTIPLNIAKPVIVNYTPQKRQTDVALREVIEIIFNRPIDPATVGTQSILVAAGTRRLNVRIFASTENGLHKLSLVPPQNLINGIVYNVIMLKTIKDLAGTPMLADFRWSFTTATRADTWETVSTFSSADQPFSDPLQNARTRNIVRDSTQYQLARKFALSDSTSGQLRYHFQPPGNNSGTVFLELRQPLKLDSDEALAFFLFGDNSKNTLTWHFRTRAGSAAIYEQAIDFTNWRDMSFEVGRDSLTLNNQKVAALAHAPLQFDGFALTNSGVVNGEILFEDLFYIHPPRTAVAESPVRLPNHFVLEQNFPNPFWSAATSPASGGGSPGTEIKFSTPQRVPVKITIVDPLGRLVRVLVDGILENGTHRTSWDGRDENAVGVASGIYFVKMHSRDFFAVRKLLLVR